ncbi:lysylphosphatidylglycerol synthase transmembrane domain-containing protein [Angustibacter sp. McL0619]|uniref:lysylphosphatidylglycerol synthase transmembrane domain-containing protein n=1 Tax=Angustibacter sp. McL0619 TaxID=3415676 RepID=UPI003CEA8702
MSGTWLRWARVLVGAAIVVALLWRVGADPFLDALRRIDAVSLAAAFVIAVVTTVCCAWRWSLVSRGLGVAVPLRVAVRACYRSQFLNTTLPGGVIGDVHRGVRAGRDVGDVGRSLRAVAWERSAGQVVQLALAVGVLLVLSSPLRSVTAVVAVTVAGGVACAVLAALALSRGGRSWPARLARTVRADVRLGLLARRAWPGVLLASAVVVVGHALTFVIAVRTAGSTAPLTQVLPLALLALLAMSIPANVAGWGPREGVAAWSFGLVGLGAAQGVTAAVVYGVLAFVASLPGAAVLVAEGVARG